MAFIMLRCSPSLPTLVRVFIMNWCWICEKQFVKCFFCIYWDDHVVFYFYNVMYYIDWFVYVEPFLWTWDQSYLVMLDHVGIVGFYLLVFCWEFFHLCSSNTLACNFLFWWYLCLILWVLWLHRMSLWVFSSLQCLGRAWEESLSSLFGRTRLWSCLVLDFCSEFVLESIWSI